MMTDSPRQTTSPTFTVLVVYYATLATFLLASFFPQHRVWGINFWAYFPSYVPLMLFALGAVVPFAITLIPRTDCAGRSNRRYYAQVLGLTLLFGLGFYFLRAHHTLVFLTIYRADECRGSNEHPGFLAS